MAEISRSCSVVASVRATRQIIWRCATRDVNDVLEVCSWPVIRLLLLLIVLVPLFYESPSTQPSYPLSGYSSSGSTRSTGKVKRSELDTMMGSVLASMPSDRMRASVKDWACRVQRARRVRTKRMGLSGMERRMEREARVVVKRRSRASYCLIMPVYERALSVELVSVVLTMKQVDCCRPLPA